MLCSLSCWLSGLVASPLPSVAMAERICQERLIGWIRRECLDHVIVLNAAGLQRVITAYVAYYTRARTHLSLDKDSPSPRPVMPAMVSAIRCAAYGTKPPACDKMKRIPG